MSDKKYLTLNVDLLNKVADAIEREPENYNQQHYHCGTAHCVGGWAALLSGAPQGELNEAAEALGLTTHDAQILFAGCWKPADGFTPSSALRAIADGKTIQQVSDGFGIGGFGRDGFDRGGFGRDGFGRDGFDRDGFDRGRIDAYGRTKTAE